MKALTIVMPAAALAATLLAGGVLAHTGHDHGATAKAGALKCPVMGTAIKDPATAPKVMVNNSPVYLCCADCPAAFKKDPAKFVKRAKDPVTGKAFKVSAKSPKLEQNGDLFFFSSVKSETQFQKDPAKFSKPGGK